MYIICVPTAEVPPHLKWSTTREWAQVDGSNRHLFAEAQAARMILDDLGCRKITTGLISFQRHISPYKDIKCCNVFFFWSNWSSKQDILGLSNPCQSKWTNLNFIPTPFGTKSHHAFGSCHGYSLLLMTACCNPQAATTLLGPGFNLDVSVIIEHKKALIPKLFPNTGKKHGILCGKNAISNQLQASHSTLINCSCSATNSHVLPLHLLIEMQNPNPSYLINSSKNNNILPCKQYETSNQRNQT